MRGLFVIIAAVLALTGCDAIFGIEVLDERPAGAAGSDGGGGAGGVAPNGGGNVGGDAVGGMGTGGDACSEVPEICGDGLDQNCDNVPDDGCSIGAYVSALIGKDDYPGTEAFPVKTIAEGIAHAVDAGLDEVIVAQGTYAEVVTLVPAIDVVGGHHCENANDCSWTPDPQQYTTTIQPSNLPAVTTAAGVSRTTTLTGFEIRGASQTGKPGDTTYATIELEDASPRITENFIYGPNVSCDSWCTVSAIWIHGDGAPDDEGPLVDLNAVAGGEGSHAAHTIHIHDKAAVLSNIVAGGQGLESSGIAAQVGDGLGRPVLIQQNDVAAGTCDGGGTQVTNGIVAGSTLGSAGIVVDGNRVNAAGSAGSCGGCPSTRSCGGIWVQGGNVTVTNNVAAGVGMATNTHGLLITDGEGNAVGTVIVNSNTLLGGPVMSSSTLAAAVRLRLFDGADAVAGRIRNNILDGHNGSTTIGILEASPAGKTLVPELVENNHFQNVGVFWSHWDGSNSSSDMDISVVDANPTAENNQTGTCSYATSFHLQLGGPCADNGTSTEAPDVDIDGDMRPEGAGYDIGADEVE